MYRNNSRRYVAMLASPSNGSPSIRMRTRRSLRDGRDDHRHGPRRSPPVHRRRLCLGARHPEAREASGVFDATHGQRREQRAQSGRIIDPLKIVPHGASERHGDQCLAAPAQDTRNLAHGLKIALFVQRIPVMSDPDVLDHRHGQDRLDAPRNERSPERIGAQGDQVRMLVGIGVEIQSDDPKFAGPILDIGCCSSREPVALASRGFRVIGVDFNAYPYKHPNLVALRADALRAPLISGSVEAVLAVSVIEHIGIGHYRDPLDEKGDLKAVREIARVLRRGGKALITVPFGRAMRDDFQRVYDPPGLRALLAPLTVRRIEYARSLSGLWMPCTEAEAASVDWRGPSRAVAMVVATVAEGASGAHPD